MSTHTYVLAYAHKRNAHRYATYTCTFTYDMHIQEYVHAYTHVKEYISIPHIYVHILTICWPWVAHIWVF